MQGVMGGGGGVVTQQEVTVVFYFAALVQGFGSGIVAGVFEDGHFTSGVKHMFIMVGVSWILFKILLGV
jgi:flagellar protein FlaJ